MYVSRYIKGYTYINIFEVYKIINYIYYILMHKRNYKIKINFNVNDLYEYLMLNT